MRRFIILFLLAISSICNAQVDSLNINQTNKTHRVFIEGLGSGVLLSVGYNFEVNLNNKHFFSANIATGGTYAFNRKPYKTFLLYYGLKYGYNIFKNTSLNVYANYANVFSLFGVFKKEELTLEEYCYENHLSSCPKKYFSYFNYGISLEFRKNKKLGFELEINKYLGNVFNLKKSIILPGFKISYKL